MTFSKQYLFALILLSLYVISCGDDDGIDIFPEDGQQQPQEETNTIVDIASADAQFSTLVAALQRADLVDALNSAGPFTVFAPTNEAFEILLAENGVSSLDELSVDVLRNILLYHVLDDVVESSDLSNGYIQTINTTGPDGTAIDLFVDIIATGPTLNFVSNITTVDIDADNGIVHVIDRVLNPPSIVEILAFNPRFNTLFDAIFDADLLDALSASGPFTLFAPTNEAFDGLLTNLGVSEISEIPVETLTNVLLYHVVSGNIRSSDLTNGMVSTLNENNMIEINTDNGASLNGDVNIVEADVQGTNGVIHFIDQVLVPEF